jgi:hypothetical protein
MYSKSHNSSFGTETGYGLDDRSSKVRFLAGADNCSLHHRVQNRSGAHTASYPMGTRGSFPAVKRPGREADPSPPSSSEVENAWSYTSILPNTSSGKICGTELCNVLLFRLSTEHFPVGPINLPQRTHETSDKASVLYCPSFLVNPLCTWIYGVSKVSGMSR